MSTLQLRLLFAFAFLVSLLSFASAQGEIRQSEDWLVKSSQHRALDSLKEKLGYPDPPIGKGLVVLVTGGGGTGNVLVVGPIEGDARKYAEALNAWQAANGGRETVEFSQENDCAAARVSTSTARFFATRAENRFDLGGLVKRLQPIGAPVRLALRVPKHVTATGLGKPDFETQTARVYNFEGKNPPTVAMSVSLPPSLPVLFWLFVAFVPFCGLLGLGLAAYVGTRSAIPIERRRKLYSKLALYPTFGAIAVHTPFALWLITSKALTPVADVWMGSTSAAAFLMPFVMLPLPFMMVVPLFLGKMEKRLFGATEGETSTVPPPPEPDEATKATKKKVRNLALVLIGIGSLFWIGSSFMFSPKEEWRFLPKLGGMLLALLGSQIASLVYRKEVKRYEGDLDDPALDAMARRLGDRMGVPVRSLKISREAVANSAPSATVNGKGEVRVTDRARQVMDPAEIEFLIARALAGRKQRHSRQRGLLMLLPFLGTLPIFYLPFRIANPSLPRLPVGAVMIGPMVAMVVVFLLGSRITKRQELEKDRVALEVTGNLAAAEAALWKTKMAAPMPHAEEASFLSQNPDLAKRLAALRAARAT